MLAALGPLAELELEEEVETAILTCRYVAQVCTSSPSQGRTRPVVSDPIPFGAETRCGALVHTPAPDPILGPIPTHPWQIARLGVMVKNMKRQAQQIVDVHLDDDGMSDGSAAMDDPLPADVGHGSGDVALAAPPPPPKPTAPIPPICPPTVGWQGRNRPAATGAGGASVVTSKGVLAQPPHAAPASLSPASTPAT